MISYRFVSAIAAASLLAAAGLDFARPATSDDHCRAHLADSPRAAPLPPIILWAWDRPEDLRSIDPAVAGVAFLARTVFLTGDSVSVRPRLQPLRVPPHTALVAVVRIESSRRLPPLLFSHQLDQTSRAVAAAAALPGLAGLQIDFDATSSEQAFYRDLIAAVHAEIPRRLSLSITALASWCLGDNWLAGLPLDDAVPMLFRMGVGTREVSLHLGAGGDFRAPACRQSLGLSTDEPISNLPHNRRLYIFSPRAWTPGAAQLATQMVRP
ncbi:MAG: DUF3142 domain-containing protein [Candidatus Acidiferrales bacterium]